MLRHDGEPRSYRKSRLFKTLVTLMRGSAAAAAEDLADRRAELGATAALRAKYGPRMGLLQAGRHPSRRRLAAARHGCALVPT